MKIIFSHKDSHGKYFRDQRQTNQVKHALTWMREGKCFGSSRHGINRSLMAKEVLPMDQQWC